MHIVGMSGTLVMDNATIDEIESCQYLGGFLSGNGGAELDVRRCIQIASLAFISLNSIWSFKVFASCVNVNKTVFCYQV